MSEDPARSKEDVRIVELYAHVMALKSLCSIIISRLHPAISEEIRGGLRNTTAALEVKFAEATDQAAQIFLRKQIECFTDIVDRADRFDDFLEDSF